VLGLLAASLIAAHLGAPSAQTTLDVQPFPGTPDASPRSELVLPSGAHAVVVRGSLSGRHAGRLEALPDGRGTAFLPSKPFADGERVVVSFFADARAAAFSFGVKAPLHSGPQLAMRNRARAAAANTQTFHSIGGLHPPVISTSGTDPDPGAGDIFVDAQNAIQVGPMILDPFGQLLWFASLKHTALNLEVQSYQGQSVLTYYYGPIVSPGVGMGQDVILNHNYQTVATVNAGNGYHADLHEFQLTPQGTALITVFAPVKANLSSVHGPRKGTVLDSIIQEIDIATGKLLWEWHAYGHVPLADSYAALGLPYDFFHINSVQQLPNGNLLISGRHTWAVYEISKRTGKVVWRLGGKHSSFKMGRGTNFEWQHDAHLSGRVVTVLDNAAGPAPASERQSRALRIALDLKHRQATLVRAYTNTPPALSSNEGSIQLLADANAFVGWGSVPYFTEFGRLGRQRFSVHFPLPTQSYRAYRFPWWGKPTTPPAIAVSSSSATGTMVYASWNGATAVASWKVLAGLAPGTLIPIGQFPKTSFETAIPVMSTGPYFEVQALDGSGNVLATSTPAQLSPPAG
jgi:hypothetical protein